VDAIIVDDYRLSQNWELMLRQIKVPIVVLDDQNKKSHECDLLIDAKWEGSKTCARYAGKLPNHAIKLLGPKYLILDKKYENFTGEVFPLKRAPSKKAKILVSLGGGGDAKFLTALLLELEKINEPASDFTISIVVGPFLKNKHLLYGFVANCIGGWVELIEGETQLINFINESDLYVGAAGGTLFEALILRIPCLSFSIGENQENQISDFESMGHYFHLNNISLDDIQDFASLVFVMLSNLDRLNALYGMPCKLTIDGYGLGRVFNAINKLINHKHVESFECVIDDTSNQEKDFYQIDDRYINKYLLARNLEKNLERMTDKKPVSFLIHYIWWLKSNKRHSYVLCRKGVPMLYIWHQVVVVDDINVLVGGWFVASDTCSALDAVAALEKQLKITDFEHPDLSWVAVIHHKNHFVQKMNERFGFIKLNDEDVMYEVAQKCFPMAHQNDFYYFFRPSVNN
jgi:spore coat polysaccharide biosynthesis predicted glycosyltransferase SpsG